MKSGDLMDMRNALLLQVERANAAIAKAEGEQEPYREAFNAAHNDLLRLHALRGGDARISKAVMLAGYDKRMWAGFRWQPFKAALRDAEAWRSGLIKEIGEINKELDRR